MANIINGLLYGLPVMGIGLLIVFIALIILICAIYILSAAVRAMTGKKEKKAAPAPAPVVVAPAPVEEEVEEEEGISEEIIAVISAAIAAFDQTNAKLVVRSVRRKGAWGKASREEQVYRF